MTNINVEIFKRYKPETKLEIISKLTESELLDITKETVLRIIKEAGVGRNEKQSRNKFKTLRLRNRVGNDWNSRVYGLENVKGDRVLLEVYLQGDDIDTTDYCDLTDFLSKRCDVVCCANLHEEFRNGYSHTIPANYYKEDRARVIREILNTYVHEKYGV